MEQLVLLQRVNCSFSFGSMGGWGYQLKDITPDHHICMDTKHPWKSILCLNPFNFQVMCMSYIKCSYQIKLSTQMVHLGRYWGSFINTYISIRSTIQERVLNTNHLTLQQWSCELWIYNTLTSSHTLLFYQGTKATHLNAFLIAVFIL